MNKHILRLAIPNILSNLSVPLLSIADTALMGRLEDSALYIGAIALGSIIFNFVYWGFGFLRMGTTGLTAQAYGARDYSEISMILCISLAVGFLGAILLLIFQWPIGEWGFSLIKGDEEVKAVAKSYYYIRIWAAPATIASYTLHGWFLGMQNARIPMYLTITVNALNIGLNFLFVFGMGMKADGVALATVIAQYLGIIAAIGFFFAHYKGYLSHFSQSKLFKKEALIKFFTVSRDIFIRTLCLIFVFTFFTNESSGFSKEVLAINSILLQFFFVLGFGIDGFAYAAESLVGKYKGAEAFEELKVVVRYLFFWGGGIASIGSIVYILFPEPLLHIFTDDPQLIEAALPFILWMVAVSFIGGFAFIWDGVYIGATATKAMRNMMLISMPVFFIAYYALVDSWGNHALWFAMVLFMLSRAISLSWVSPKNIFSS